SQELHSANGEVLCISLHIQLGDPHGVGPWRELNHGICRWLSPTAEAPSTAPNVTDVSLAENLCIMLGRSSIGVWLRGSLIGGDHSDAVWSTNSYPKPTSALPAYLKNCVA